MALRSLGSSLVAKAQPGSASRDTIEARITKPSIPGKGAPGSTERNLVEEPLLNTTPGTEKVVSVAPEAEAASMASPGGVTPDQTALLAGAVGRTPQTNGSAPGSDGQALFQGGLTPTSAAAPTVGGRAAKAVSAPALRSGAANIGLLPSTAPKTSTQVQAARPTSVSQAKPTSNQLSSNTALGTGGGVAAAGKALLSGISKVASKVAPVAAKASLPLSVFSTFATPSFQAEQARQANVAQNKSINQQIANTPKGQPVFGGTNAKITAAPPKAAPSNVLRSVAQPVKQVASNIRSTVENAANKLRSLFGRK